jgi:hypothetical protein
MLYRLLADLTVIIHLAFILFVLFGALFCFRWRKFYLIHLPAFVWGFFVELMGWICPLTPLENYFYHLGGEAGYSGGFIEHYLIPIIYPAGLTRELQFVYAVAVIVINMIIYFFYIRNRIRHKSIPDN